LKRALVNGPVVIGVSAVTRAMSRATSNQPIANASISERETTSQLVDDHSDSSSPLLSWETLIKEQERDK